MHRSVAAALTVHLSPCGRGRIASQDAIRVRGRAVSWDVNPLTRAFGATSPRGGEVVLADAALETIDMRF